MLQCSHTGTCYNDGNVPENWRRWSDVGLVFGQRIRRWSNTKPTSGQRLVFFLGAPSKKWWPALNQRHANHGATSDQRWATSATPTPIGE